MTREELNVFLSDEVSLENKKIIIWGTGNTAELYQNGLNRLVEAGDFSIYGYGDNNSEKIGTEFHGYRIYSAKEVASIDGAVCLIATPQKRVSDAVSEQLDALGIENYLLDKVIFSMHRQDILQVYDMMLDEKSREIYAQIAYCRMTNDYINEDIVSGNTYFSIPAFVRTNPNEVFLECGGYVGDTLEQYLWKRTGQFKKIISFEPDINNYKAMSYRCERLKREWNLSDEDMVLYQYGVGDEDLDVEVASYDTNHGLGSRMLLSTEEGNENELATKIVRLDSIIKERVDFIKADIESYEYKMLLGASEIVKKYTPKIAICIYHNAADFFQIPLLIHSLDPAYKFAVRQHSYDLDETVLYAWKE